MLHTLLALFSVGLNGSAGTQTTHPVGKPNPVAINKTAGFEMPCEFIENRGQWKKEIRFLGRGPGVNMWITDNGITYDYYRTDAEKKKTSGQVVKVSFAGANEARKSVATFDKKTTTYNFFLGNDHSKWASHVPAYSAATIKNLYKGVDLVAYFDQKQRLPRYDLVVHPGADASKIAMRYQGADRLHMNDQGMVAYNTSLGKVEERDLVAYQPHDGLNVDQARAGIVNKTRQALASIDKVKAQMTLSEDGTVRFVLAQHDPSKEVVIDPAVWSTWLDSSEVVTAKAVQTAPDGSPYVFGAGTISDLLTPGSYQTAPTNIFYAKYSADGKRVDYATYLGGSYFDQSGAFAVQSNGSVVIGGYASTPDFPRTGGSFGGDLAANWSPANTAPAFVTKFTPEGGLQYSSVFAKNDGSNLNAFVFNVAVDDAGAVYAFGNGSNVNGYVSPGALHLDSSGDNQCYVLKFRPDGSGLEWGIGTGITGISNIGVDGAGHLYLLATWEPLLDVPVTRQTLPAEMVTGGQSVLVAKLSTDGTSFDYCEYIAGSNDFAASGAHHFFIDHAGNAYVAGTTAGPVFLSTPGAFQQYDGQQHIFLAKLDPDGEIVYAAPIGDANIWGIMGITAATDGSLMMLAATIGEGEPTTPGATQRHFTGSAADFISNGYLVRISPTGDRLLYGSYLPFNPFDATADGGISAAPGSDSAYLTCFSMAANYAKVPATPGAFAPSPPAGFGTGFLMKFQMQPERSLAFIPNTSDGSTPVVGTYSLAGPAASDTVVSLRSAHSSAAVPSKITIPAGQTFVNFPVTIKGADSPTNVLVTATESGTTRSDYVKVLPATVDLFSITPTTISGSGKTVTGTIRLHGNAGPSGVGVLVTSSDPTAAWVPFIVSVPYGKASTTFPILPQAVTSVKTVTITVRDALGNTVGTADLTVGPIEVATIMLGATSVYGGTSTIGKVTLNGVAPFGGATVNLTSSDPSVTVPASVTVPDGSTTASFDVTTDAAFAGPDKTVTVTAGSVTAPLLVKVVTPTLVTVSPAALYGGWSATGTVTLNAVAPTGGLAVALSASNPAALNIPASVVFPAGAKTATFPVSVPLGFAGSESVTVTATGRGTPVSRSVSVRPLALSRMSISASTVTGGANVTLTVVLSAATQSPVTVTLSSDSAKASLPATVVVPTGASSATVTVNTSAVTARTSAHLTATYAGVSKAVALTINK